MASVGTLHPIGLRRRLTWALGFLWQCDLQLSIVANTITLQMLKSIASALALIILLATINDASAAPIYKCSVNGAVHYQQSPCQAIEGRKPPTVDELNAARKKQLAQQDERRTAQKPQVNPQPMQTPATQEATRPLASSSSAFKCDGRQHCTQMSSCAEAKYFLSNCPGVKMDGDGDGIPCEEQHCGQR